jgi:hypothetical protein
MADMWLAHFLFCVRITSVETLVFRSHKKLFNKELMDIIPAIQGVQGKNGRLAISGCGIRTKGGNQ